jgi:hypothetical protein
MARTRAEHLQWCKDRALPYAEAGDKTQAIASMLSDLNKWDEPLYEKDLITLMFQDATFFRSTPAELKDWINGFN